MPFIDFISKRLSQLGWSANEVLGEDAVRVDIDFNGYPCSILISVGGKNRAGQTTLRLLSLAFPLTGDESLDAPMSLMLLRRNTKSLTARWEVVDVDEKSVFVVSAAMLAETMDPEELRGAFEDIAAEHKEVTKLLQRHSVDV